MSLDPDTMSPQLFTLFILLSFVGVAKGEDQYKKGKYSGEISKLKKSVHYVSESPVEMNSGINANGTGQLFYWFLAAKAAL